MTVLRVDDTDVHVQVDGPEGAPILVMVHGMTCSLRWYDAITALLADTFRVIRMDLRGHGSTRGGSGLQPADQARMIAALLDALGVTAQDDVTLIGHSWGNDATTDLAASTGLVTRIVVLGQGPSYAPGVATMPRVGALLALPYLARLHRFAPDALLRGGLALGFAPGFDHQAAFADPQQAYIDLRGADHRIPRIVIHDRRAQLAANGLDKRLQVLGLPALVILGEQDSFYPPEASRALYEAVGAQVVVLGGVGHSVQVERPVEVAQLIRDFAPSAA
ncbi:MULTISPECIES: alpha/beta fold hydrolase [unclassified Nocardioides]|uniref:alpha/beta fold hydrolase n=1 Tax=unclassified Nocardioides TaxID=2615069 RepID=UPI000A8D44C1|nr:MULTISPECIES: alpha/beta hydrolase [unclassified Nocardioides]